MEANETCVKSDNGKDQIISGIGEQLKKKKETCNPVLLTFFFFLCQKKKKTGYPQKKYPDHYNSVSLATEFRISPEAVKRILKSKFRPEPIIADRQEKNRYAAMGVRKQQIQSKTITFPSTSSDMTSRKSPGKHHSSSSISTWKKE
ncbi:hypothetical protein BCR42DRAFT_407961 [Absidia repens]|uniref:Required for respiratory growth protein 9, mitochondrial n=1 Tax=Absidia repens TaxID=90262 RepID=A0A1X2ISY6_9FUNG|nr:hypothetical protein BCR42DRAFT_407961 [Absidia repens]